MKWWKKLWESETGSRPAPRRPERASEEPAEVVLWIEPLEERFVVGLIWGR